MWQVTFVKHLPDLLRDWFKSQADVSRRILSIPSTLCVAEWSLLHASLTKRILITWFLWVTATWAQKSCGEWVHSGLVIGDYWPTRLTGPCSISEYGSGSLLSSRKTRLTSCNLKEVYVQGLSRRARLTFALYILDESPYLRLSCFQVCTKFRSGHAHRL